MVAAQAGNTRLPLPARLFLASLGVAVAAWLLWTGDQVHLRRACVLMDTPYLPLCGDAPESDGDRQRSNLRARLAANPGDSSAWIRLTNLETGPSERALLHAASTLAPTEPNVLMWRAGDALSRNELPRATELLVQLIEYRGKGEAADALARIVASGEGTVLLRPHLATASRWLPQVLGSMTALKLPLTAALPLLAEASAKGAVPQQTIHAYIRALKADGKWADAYGLWPDGFDWEVTPVLPSLAGALARQRGMSNRGRVLEIEFTGRPVAIPILRQYVFIGPGKYLLRGRYKASGLRMEQGLAWSVRCTDVRSAKALAGRSDGLQDTAGAWQSFQFAFAIPHDCGLVASVQLETFAPFEAVAGFKGRVSFDGFELAPDGV
jgi:hypothetical protein